MAKGRWLFSSPSERLLGVGGAYHHRHSHHGEESQVAELGEDDVWSVVDETPESHHRHRGYSGTGDEWAPRAAVESGRGWADGINSGCRHLGGLSLAFEEQRTSSRRIVHQLGGDEGGPRGGRHMAASAPVNVPDWCKILRVKTVESMHDSEDDLVGDSGMEPPHEYLARSRKMNAMSVFEGVGRTLKGRAMSRVRDAVWSQTGFEG